MVLRVPATEFVRAAKEVCGAERGYVCAEGTETVLSAGGRGVIVIATSPRPIAEARTAMESAGLPVAEGRWSLDGAAEAQFGTSGSAPHVAAVAYSTGSEKPGLWIDATPESRTTGQIVQALYDEFTAGGEIEAMTFEEFVESAHPTVIELTPDAMAKHLAVHTRVE